MPPIDNKQRNQGFTLIELIIVITLLGILATVGSSMLVNTFTAARLVDAGNANADRARYAVERLAREIREVKRVSSSYCIDTRNATTFVFRKRILADTNTTACGTGTTTVSIAYTNPNLTLNNSSVTGGPYMLDGQVSAFSLVYLQSDGATAATGNDNVQYVEINLTVTDTATSGQTFSERTRVALRNR